MANVTFIIGNGLDLSLGLKTSYKDFYRHVQAKKLNPKNKIYSSISKDPDTWAEFELSLGTYTKYIEDLPEKGRKKESLEFHNDLVEVTSDLADYLTSQEELIENKASRLSITRNSFFEELPIGQRTKIQSLLGNDKLNLNFITLNYTHTLEKLLPEINTHNPQNLVIRNIHHIHGDLEEDVTFGVSDETQLSSALEGDERDDLIKPRNIESMNDNRIPDMQRIIQNSHIIILYGTSIGKTDKYIWMNLIDWLTAHANRHIIIHKHNLEYTDKTKRIPRRKKLFISNVQDNILSHIEIDEDKKDELRGRIFVIHNTKKLLMPIK